VIRPRPKAAGGCGVGRTIPDVDIWRAALLMVKRYGDDAMREAGARARELMADGDMDGCTTWMHIGDAIERLQAKAPSSDSRAKQPDDAGNDEHERDKDKERCAGPPGHRRPATVFSQMEFLHEYTRQEGHETYADRCARVQDIGGASPNESEPAPAIDKADAGQRANRKHCRLNPFRHNARPAAADVLLPMTPPFHTRPAPSGHKISCIDPEYRPGAAWAWRW
jgi:hypothetical protein